MPGVSITAFDSDARSASRGNIVVKLATSEDRSLTDVYFGESIHVGPGTFSIIEDPQNLTALVACTETEPNLAGALSTSNTQNATTKPAAVMEQTSQLFLTQETMHSALSHDVRSIGELNHTIDVEARPSSGKSSNGIRQVSRDRTNLDDRASVDAGQASPLFGTHEVERLKYPLHQVPNAEFRPTDVMLESPQRSGVTSHLAYITSTSKVDESQLRPLTTLEQHTGIPSKSQGSLFSKKRKHDDISTAEEKTSESLSNGTRYHGSDPVPVSLPETLGPARDVASVNVEANTEAGSVEITRNQNFISLPAKTSITKQDSHGFGMSSDGHDSEDSLLDMAQISKPDPVRVPSSHNPQALHSIESSQSPSSSSPRDAASPEASKPKGPQVSKVEVHVSPPTNPMGRLNMETGSLVPQERISSVIFAQVSPIGKSKKHLEFLKRNKVKRVTSVKAADVLCIGRNEDLKRTAKILAAILLGKPVVTDAWVTASYEARQIKSTEPYLARDYEMEQEWGTSLKDALARGRQGVKPLLNWTIMTTPALRTRLGRTVLEDLRELCILAGSSTFLGVSPKQSIEHSPSTIVLAVQDDQSLRQLHKDWRLHSHDIISFSILRGVFKPDEDEFLIHGAPRNGR